MKTNEIRFIRVQYKNGNLRSVFVASKSYRVSDSKQYYTESLDYLPKYVKRFISGKSSQFVYADKNNGDIYAEFIYK